MPMPYVEELYSYLDAQPDKGNFWGAMPYPIDTRDYPEDAPLHKALLNSMGHRDDSFYSGLQRGREHRYSAGSFSE